MRMTFPILAALLALSACGEVAPPQPATVRLPAVPGRPASGYFELLVDDDRGALTSVSSPQAGRIEMHETMSAGNMTSMRALDRIPAPAGDRLIFAPGGRHLMLYDVDPAIHAGSEIDLLLHFERGEPRPITARVEAAGGPE